MRRLQQVDRGLTDGQLLGSYIATRDEVAFAALLRQHGPMVMSGAREHIW